MHVDVYFEKGLCVMRRSGHTDPEDAADEAARTADRLGCGVKVVAVSAGGVVLAPCTAWMRVRDASPGLRIRSVCLVEKMENAPRVDDTPF